MFTGFEKIVEQRILEAQRRGEFENLPGEGQPLDYPEDRHLPEELRIAHKILKNADCLPPELELKNEILRTEDLLADMQDTAEKYHALKKLNFLIMKLNSLRNTSVDFELPQHYETKLAERFGPSASKHDAEKA